MDLLLKILHIIIKIAGLILLIGIGGSINQALNDMAEEWEEQERRR